MLIMDTAADQCTCGGSAWIITNVTGEEIKCNGYIKNNDENQGHILPVVSAITCVRLKDADPFILLVNQACYHDDENQNESLCLPYQAEQHGVTFSLTPRDREDSMGNKGKQNMVIEGKEIPLNFDGRKMYLNISRPTNDEIDALDFYELTSPDHFDPTQEKTCELRRKRQEKDNSRLPGNFTMDHWRKCLALAPEDVIRKTFMATTQLAMNVEAENRTIPRRHYKSRFAFLKEKRVNDTFHSDTFFPTAKAIDGETCSQLFLGRKSDYMYVKPMKTESHSFRALQDFGRKVGLPKVIKTDNAATEVGTKWTNWCRDHCVDTKYTEPYSPWQNIAEQGIGNLGTMVRRCMRAFGAPISRHAWCQKWCADVRNILASRKLEWRTPTEILTGDTPDISVFRFHFWQKIEYYEPALKQPYDGWMPGRFLGIAWDSGDAMTFYVEPIRSGPGRRAVLTRSTIRPYTSSSALLSPSIPDSGEMKHETQINHDEDNSDFGFHDSNIQNDNDTSSHLESSTPEKDEQPIQNNNTVNDESTQDHAEHETIKPDDVINEKDQTGTIEETDDANEDHDDDTSLLQEDDAILTEQLANIARGDEEDFEFNCIIGHKWESGLLIFDVELTSGKNVDIPFHLLKKDRPIETAQYIKINVIEESRHGQHITWSNKILKQANRSMRRLSRYHNIDRLLRIRKFKDIRVRRVSRNKRMENKVNRIKFGIKVPNSVREALIFDNDNQNTLWSDAIKKEMTALDNAKVFEYLPGHVKIPKHYQYAPLRVIFDIKQEDLRRKARLVAGGHVVDSSMYESYSSVVQTMMVRLLQTVALKHDLKIVTGDIGNAFVQAMTKEKIWSKAGPEFGKRQGCKIIIKKALYGLATSARQWNLKLGDSFKALGFKPSRADTDLWLKESAEHSRSVLKNM